MSSILAAIYRHPDSVAMISHKNENGQWADDGWVTPEGMNAPSVFQRFIDRADSFVSLNSFFAPERLIKHDGVSPRYATRRREENLRSLNSCYVDIDCGREGEFSAMEAKVFVMRLAHEGRIPKPSGYVMSGRGLWVLWLLEPSIENCSSGSVRLDLYKRVNEALQGVLSALPVDKETKDGARMIRIPGSTNRANGNEVNYTFEGNSGQPVYRYELRTLAADLKVVLPHKKKKKRLRAKAIQGAGKAGFIALNESRLSDLEKLFQSGVITKGMRRTALTEVLKHMIALGFHNEVRVRKVKELAKMTLPRFEELQSEILTPLSNIQPGNLVPQGGEKANLPFRSNLNLVSKLRITVELATKFGLVQIIPKELKEQRQLEKTKKWKVGERRNRIVQMRSQNPKMTRFEIADLIGVSIATLDRDLAWINRCTTSPLPCDRK